MAVRNQLICRRECSHPAASHAGVPGSESIRPPFAGGEDEAPPPVDEARGATLLPDRLRVGACPPASGKPSTHAGSSTGERQHAQRHATAQAVRPAALGRASTRRTSACARTRSDNGGTGRRHGSTAGAGRRRHRVRLPTQCATGTEAHSTAAQARRSTVRGRGYAGGCFPVLRNHAAATSDRQPLEVARTD